ncbi:BrnT family toxin [Desulfococcaceae bacterium HSG7]|nr:BrnT family toxin [Desulfococcaceae bacterium HSG9]MDM8554934.1 BrnT family toxin [Desulfococcaceae bacterium HSG7]
MKYEWDDSKRKANIAKHGVDFLSAEEFDWSTAIEVIDDRSNYGEDRWITLGFIGNRLHIMIYTDRIDTIRIIRLRKADKRERGYYEMQTK